VDTDSQIVFTLHRNGDLLLVANAFLYELRRRTSDRRASQIVPEIQDMPEIQDRRNHPRHQTLLGGSGDRSFAGLFRSLSEIDLTQPTINDLQAIAD
jgi:hypothetical protein